ncbi:ATP-dependent helicase [Kineococcus gynurae]|uniref:DNA 3'-5' helicase n=1 Tax=Kineococcus gynurae TaxID=452979 RepID=A0ABV5LN94_9ACTN
MSGSGPWIGATEIAARLGRPAPTPEQVRIIEAPVEPMLVVAGAGSGKTETMSSRVVWLVANQLVAPEDVLGLTFTRKAAGELAERVRRRLRGLRALGLAGPGDEAGPGQEAGIGEGDPVVSTYHAYAASLVTDHGLRIGVEPASTVLSDAGSWQLATEIVERWRGDLPDVEITAGTLATAILQAAGECAEHLTDPARIDDLVTDLTGRITRLPRDDKAVRKLGAHVPGDPYAEVKKVLTGLRARRSLLPLLAEYGARKREADQLDFGDQVQLAARLAREVPAVGALERSRHRVVLLDEYQDTSYAQLALLRALFGGGHPVTAVGDPHQSIYGWRGASAGNLAGFPARFRRVDDTPAAVAPLATSWRNDEAVLAAANVVAEPLSARAEGATVGRLVARPGAGPGRVRTSFAATVEEEAAEVAARIAEVWRADTARLALDPAATRRTAAVLCRRRSSFVVLHRALREAGLPVQVVGLGGLLSTPEVVDVVATLHVLHDPGRGDQLARLLTGARCRLGARDLVALGSWARAVHRRRLAPTLVDPAPDDLVVAPDEVESVSLVEALDELPPPGWRDAEGLGLGPEARERAGRLAQLLRRLRSRTSSLGVADLVGEVERALLLDIEVAARPGARPALDRANLDALADAAAGFAASSRRPTLGGFLSWLEAAEVRERGLEPGAADVSSEAVQLLTVHASKGLEWDVVAVPGLVEGTFPAGGDTASGWLGGPGGIGVLPYPLRGDGAHLPQWDVVGAGTQKELDEARVRFREACGDHEMAEERRLAYVAFTRAKTELLLSGAWWDDATKPRVRSRFLTELLAAADEGRVPGLVQLPGAPPPEAGEVNPRTAEAVRVPWPVDPLAARREDVDAGAARVRAAVLAGPEGAGRELPEGAEAEVAEWREQVRLLLAERSAGASAPRVELPAHLSASRLVALAEDPAALALQLRRPVPQQPRASTRRGTAFHAWLEQRFTAGRLMDLDDLPGAADETAENDDELAALQRNFLASPWASRDPLMVEVSVETPVAGLVVRGRIDAVFTAPDGPHGRVRHDVVDWKTGRPPTGRARRARDVQLAVYRLAWSRWRGVPLEDVSAAFFYASTGETVRPVDLHTAADLERLVTDLPEAAGTGTG